MSFEVELDPNGGNYYDISDNLTITDNTIEFEEGELYSINDNNIKIPISFQIDNLADIPENTYINFRLKDYDVNIGGVPIPSLFISSVDTLPHVNYSDIEFNILDADTRVLHYQ